MKFLAALCAVVFAGALGLWLEGNRFTNNVSSAAEIRDLHGRARNSSIAAHLRGVATYSDATSGFLVVQDSTGGVRVEQQGTSVWPRPGGQVNVNGVVSATGMTPSVIATDLKQTSASGNLPAALPLSLAQAQSGAFEYRRVAMRGVVRSIYIAERTGLLVLNLADGTGTVTVRIKEYANRDFRSLPDSLVRVQGVLSSTFDVYGKLSQSTVWVPDLDHIAVLEHGARVPDIPAVSVADLQHSAPHIHRVRLNGKLSGLAQGRPALQDSTGSIPISPTPVGRSDGDMVAITGYADRSGNQISLTDAAVVEGDRPEGTKPAAISTLRTAAAVRQLTAAAADNAFPVHLQGVVTYVDHWSQLLFVQDGSGGVFVSAQGRKLPDHVEGKTAISLDGVTATGGFAPVVAKPVISVLGQGWYPEPVRTDQEQLFNGRYDSQWIELPGVVHSARFSGGETLLALNLGQHTFNAHVQGGMPDFKKLIDASVRIRGVCATITNGKHQMTGIQLYVPGWDQVRIEHQPPQDPFAAPLQPLNGILQFSAKADPDHRVHVRGRVLLSHPEGPTWIGDETGGLKISDHGAISLAPGDQVDAVGFEAGDALTPFLKSAIIHKLGVGTRPKPIAAVPDDAMDGLYENDYIRVDGRLVDSNLVAGQAILLMQSGRTTFYAHVPLHGQAANWEPGSILRISGICTLEADNSGGSSVPRVFRLFAAAPDQVTVVQGAPILSRGFALRTLLFAGIALLLSVAWITLLRIKVHQQTRTIDQKLRQEAALKVEAQRASEAKGQFLANMSHEIRTPLNGIIGFTELTLGTSLSAGQRENLTTVWTSGISLLRIVNDILDFSKIEAGKMELVPAPFSIHRFAEAAIKTIHPQALERGVETKLSIDASVPDWVEGDEMRLRQVVLNLLSNAVKFTHEGEIRLSIRAAETVESRTVLEFSVSDTGVGIAREAQEFVFDAFQQADNSITRHYGGTGLGLAICKRIVALFGGEIQLDSELGRGTTARFTARLKVATQKVTAPKRGVMPEAAPMRLLVAEDNPINRRLIQRVLEQNGHSVTLGNNGLEAVDLFKNNQFDLVLMDVHMPGMDGLEATRLIRSLPGGGTIPILAFTASALDRELEQYLQAGMSGCITKPFQIAELIAKLAEHKERATSPTPA